MRPEQPECQCLACAQLQHHQANDQLLLVAIATVVVVGGLVWLVGQVAGLLTSGQLPEVTLAELPGIPVRLRDHAGHPAAAWPADVRERLPGPLAMYATLAGVLATPLALLGAGLVLHQPPAPPRPPATPAPSAGGPCHRPRTRAYPCCRRPSTMGGAVTATTLRADPAPRSPTVGAVAGRAGTGRHQPHGTRGRFSSHHQGLLSVVHREGGYVADEAGAPGEGKASLTKELLALSARCASLEQQQAQLAAVLAILAPDLAGLGLTRFPLSAALPDQFPVHGQQ
jgi:hypothetical protein